MKGCKDCEEKAKNYWKEVRMKKPTKMVIHHRDPMPDKKDSFKITKFGIKFGIQEDYYPPSRRKK